MSVSNKINSQNRVTDGIILLLLFIGLYAIVDGTEVVRIFGLVLIVPILTCVERENGIKAWLHRNNYGLAQTANWVANCIKSVSHSDRTTFENDNTSSRASNHLALERAQKTGIRAHRHISLPIDDGGLPLFQKQIGDIDEVYLSTISNPKLREDLELLISLKSQVTLADIRKLNSLDLVTAILEALEEIEHKFSKPDPRKFRAFKTALLTALRLKRDGIVGKDAYAIISEDQLFGTDTAKAIYDLNYSPIANRLARLNLQTVKVPHSIEK